MIDQDRMKWRVFHVLAYSTLIFGFGLSSLMKVDADKRRKEEVAELNKNVESCEASREEFEKGWSEMRDKAMELEKQYTGEHQEHMTLQRKYDLCNAENNILAKLLHDDAGKQCVDIVHALAGIRAFVERKEDK